MKVTPFILAVSITALLSACGKQESEAPATAAPPAPEAAAPAPEPAVTDVAQGKSVYNKTCALCHGVGAAGAPKPGDTADWGPRIAQGMDVLYKHALEGYTGSKGVMPPRGGATTLSDDEVKAAVDHMVEQSK